MTNPAMSRAEAIEKALREARDTLWTLRPVFKSDDEPSPLLDRINAALALPKEDGVFVPREPTDAMLDEGNSAIEHKTGPWGECPGLSWADARACYKAMLAAAPSALKETP